MIKMPKKILEWLNASSTVVIAVCTVVVTAFTYQTTRLSQKMSLVSEEPHLDIRLDRETGKEQAFFFGIQNGSNFDLYGVKLFKRIYLASVGSRTDSVEPVGGQDLLPCINTSILRQREGKSCLIHFDLKSILPQISRGSKICFIELSGEFEHGVTRKINAVSYRYLMLPSNDGMKFVRVTDETLWVLRNFNKSIPNL